ncbi:unnamed protein product [Pleuronectes platessa]|uniref:Uncharacterized protein n=1 Tax=Pleuronectes platessa TaxID=8262 RepID=A0A9N7V2W4_PLEPL|nr:unnamed protein product [Pleuronectes platessa]
MSLFLPGVADMSSVTSSPGDTEQMNPLSSVAKLKSRWNSILIREQNKAALNHLISVGSPTPLAAVTLTSLLCRPPSHPLRLLFLPVLSALPPSSSPLPIRPWVSRSPARSPAQSCGGPVCDGVRR